MLFKPEEKQSEWNSLAMKKWQLSQSARMTVTFSNSPVPPPLNVPQQVKVHNLLFATFFFFRRLTNQIALLLDCKIRDISHLELKHYSQLTRGTSTLGQFCSTKDIYEHLSVYSRQNSPWPAWRYWTIISSSIMQTLALYDAETCFCPSIWVCSKGGLTIVILLAIYMSWQFDDELDTHSRSEESSNIQETALSKRFFKQFRPLAITVLVFNERHTRNEARVPKPYSPIRVAQGLCFKVRLSAKPLRWKGFLLCK